MDKRYKPANESCSSYQEQLSEKFDLDFKLNDDQPLKNHVENCPDCHIYLEGLILMKNRLNQSPTKNLYPDPRIIKNISAYKNAKKGLKGAKPNPIWISIRDLFEYRIPVYQALSGVVVIFMVFLYISSGIYSSGKQVHVIDYSREYGDLNSSELYLVDTLSMGNPDRGQNAKEDSVLMSYLVPIM
jgi:hypothetical protein